MSRLYWSKVYTKDQRQIDCPASGQSTEREAEQVYPKLIAMHERTLSVNAFSLRLITAGTAVLQRKPTSHDGELMRGRPAKR